MKIQYTVQVWQEGAQFIAHAMPLDVASSGKTPESARQAVDEAVHLFLTTASEHGTLDEVLEDAGYHKSKKNLGGTRMVGHRATQLSGGGLSNSCPSLNRKIGALWRRYFLQPGSPSPGKKAVTVPI